jgi:formamidopyrimidine-DNA glycosylase
MPELPEVEVTRLGIAPHIQGRIVDDLIVRNPALRWPVPAELKQNVAGTMVQTVARRGKFILIGLVQAPKIQNAPDQPLVERGQLIVHLGMTGTLRIMPVQTPPRTHDHVDFRLGDTLLRYNDPRRFGAILWHGTTDGPIETNPHLLGLGVEPLLPPFTEEGGRLLFERTRGRHLPIKQLLLGGQIVVGVGNIYASESLFRAGINPKISAGRIGLARYARLAGAIREILLEAIQKGGSTLRDFVGSNGASGYFQLDYFVYDRAGLPCRVCGTTVRGIRQGQRSSFYCPTCQK